MNIINALGKLCASVYQNYADRLALARLEALNDRLLADMGLARGNLSLALVRGEYGDHRQHASGQVQAETGFSLGAPANLPIGQRNDNDRRPLAA